jgi:hypothetical protein
VIDLFSQLILSSLFIRANEVSIFLMTDLDFPRRAAGIGANMSPDFSIIKWLTFFRHMCYWGKDDWAEIKDDSHHSQNTRQ